MEKKEKKVTKPKSLFERLKEKTKALHAGSYSKSLEIEAERKRMMANVINRIAQGGKTININKE